MKNYTLFLFINIFIISNLFGQGQSFTPNPNKIYYLDVQEHDLRLAATGQSEDPYTTSMNMTGADVEWKFVDKGNGFWHIQRAAGGSTPRLRTDNTLNADMQATNSSGVYTYYRFDNGNISGSHYLTLPDGPANFQRLQMTPQGDILFTTTAFDGNWVSWNITEVPSGDDCQCASGENSLLVNGSFEETSNPNYDSAYDLIEALGREFQNNGVKFIDRHTDTDFPGWFATGGNALQQGGFSQGGTLELGQSGFLGVPAPDGDVFVEMDGNDHNQIITVTPSQILDWELSHRGRPGTDEITIAIGPIGNLATVSVVTSPNTAWIRHAGQYTVPSGVTQIQISIIPTGAANGDTDSSNLLDNVKVCPRNGSTVNCSNLTNIALGKATTQSSTFANNQNQFDAANAVDGNRNGNHNNNSITHTNNQQNAWWEIDLGSVSDLSSVTLWNRTNCCADRLTDFHVLVSDVPFTSTNLNTTLNQNGVNDFHFPGTAGRETDINLNRTGRYLRVQLSGTNALQLAEVEIMGCVSAQASFHQHCNYNGSSISLGIGEYSNITNLGFPNNQLSSLRVPAGLQVTLFNNTNFGGSSITFTADDACLINNSYNDLTESLIIEQVALGSRALQRILSVTPKFGQKSKLQWHFSQEDNKKVKQYLLKHSSGVEEKMEEIAIIPADEYEGLRSYEYLHDDPVNGINYYQVIVQYEDGTEDYQMVGDISFDLNLAFIQIAPNPATNYLNINIANYMDKSITYFVQSINGVKIQNGKWDIGHEDTVQLDLSNIQNGIYIIYMKPEKRKAVAVKFMIAKDY